jgi:hypothetical protein|tara:strand:- start:2389 stop:3672 length:1284 start_codon:yes stop_codon:yes gene_type:complete
MLKKKGQITIFIILGVVIIGVVSLVLVLNKPKLEGKITIDQNMVPIKSFVESCVDQIGQNAVYFTALQGGYYKTQSPKEDYSYIEIPVYWEINKASVPSIETIEIEILNYVKNNLPDCLNNFSVFKEQGFDISKGKINGNVIITQRDITFNIEYPITVTKADSVTEINKFLVRTDLNYNEKYQYAIQIMEEQTKIPDSIPLGFITNLAYDNNFIFETITLDENTVLFTLIFDQDTNNKGQPFIYSFINKYNWSGLGFARLVNIESIPTFIINESKLFKYKVKAIGDNITFSDYTDLFDIHPKTGEIMFDTSYIQNGERNILIKAEDDKGNKDFKYMRIIFDYPNMLPAIEPIGNLTAYVGQEFTYTVQATDPANQYLGLLDDTSLFDIHPLTGEIKFTPTLKGNYSIKITAVNTEGHVFEFMRLEVK